MFGKKRPKAEIHRWALIVQQVTQRSIELFVGHEVDFLSFKAEVDNQSTAKGTEVWRVIATGTVMIEPRHKKDATEEPHDVFIQMEVLRGAHQQWLLSTKHSLRLGMRNHDDKSWYDLDVALTYEAAFRAPKIEVRNHITDSNYDSVDVFWRSGRSLGTRTIIEDRAYMPLARKHLF